jgi:MFS family permease
LIIDTLSILGTLLHCIKNIPCLLIGNFIGGFSMGLNSTFIGCYISEVSPREVSGMMGIKNTHNYNYISLLSLLIS